MLGTNAETLNLLPEVPYVVDPSAFFQMTAKTITTPRRFPAPGSGAAANPVQLPQTGIVSKLQITFTGTLTVATAAVTSSDQWPYNLLKLFKLSINGQNDLFSCDGADLATLRDVRYPSYAEATDVFPGTVGGGDSIAVGTYTLFLTWEVPIAMDDTSLVGALFAQSSSTAITVNVNQALNSELFTANPANATIAGTFLVTPTSFEVPYDDKGNLVLPDVTKLHMFLAQGYPVNAVGEQRVQLVRTSGALYRLFCSFRGSATNRLSAAANAAASRKLEALRFEYAAGARRPQVWDPAAQLLALNNQHYGGIPMYDRLVFDFVKENPPRDLVLLAGVTEFSVVPTIGASVAISGATARVVQEILV